MTFKKKNDDIYTDIEDNLDNDKKKTLKRKIKNTNTKNNINQWTEENYQVINYWLDTLKFNHTINYFYFFKLKKIEGFWAWALIVLACFSSSISLFQYNDEYYYVSLISKIVLSIFTILTTLIAAWMKKENFIERVAELDKYILKTKKIIGSLEADLELPLENRISFNDFISKYKDKIIEFNSMTPLISPDDWKETIYIITKYYPEISSSLYPWNKYPEFALQIIDTYIYNKYNTCFKKIYHCFFCESICCDKRYNNKNLEENIKKMYESKNKLKPEAIKCGVKDNMYNNISYNNISNNNISNNNISHREKLMGLFNPKTKIPLFNSNKNKIRLNISDNEYETDHDINIENNNQNTNNQNRNNQNNNNQNTNNQNRNNQNRNNQNRNRNNKKENIILNIV